MLFQYRPYDCANDLQEGIQPPFKPEWLFLRTLHIITLVDSIFLKDICISLLLDPLAFKFKQSCTDFRLQNGQIEVLDSQILDSKILDLESSNFLNSSS